MSMPEAMTRDNSVDIFFSLSHCSSIPCTSPGSSPLPAFSRMLVAYFLPCSTVLWVYAREEYRNTHAVTNITLLSSSQAPCSFIIHIHALCSTALYQLHTFSSLSTACIADRVYDVCADGIIIHKTKGD